MTIEARAREQKNRPVRRRRSGGPGTFQRQSTGLMA